MSWHRWTLGALLASASGCMERFHPAYSTAADTTSTGGTGSSSESSGSSEASGRETTSGDDPAASAAATGSSDETTTVATTVATTGTTAGTTAGGLCGDGQVDPDEECDWGAANSDDAVCTANCMMAACGDGYVFEGKEECDDRNNDPADGCHLCGRTRRVFVTSEVYQGAIFMGIWGADQRCRSLAAQAELPNFATYRAWISDSTTSPSERMVRGRGRYELVNGLLVAEDWAGLLEHGPLVPINVTEKSETAEVGVWTSTNPDGTAAEGTDHCEDWSSQNFGNTAFWGVSSEVAPHWTIAQVDDNPTDCKEPGALYCFEQE